MFFWIEESQMSLVTDGGQSLVRQIKEPNQSGTAENYQVLERKQSVSHALVNGQKLHLNRVYFNRNLVVLNSPA